MLTATTYIRPYKAAGKGAVQTMEERFDYGLNPKKLGALSSYLCDPATAPAEFLLVKSQYQAETGRAVERGALFFQIRQAFPPGEVTAEEANQIGYETAMRWTKGKYQFFVCTHTDKGHLHNHIYFNSTAFDRSRKFHNFIGSSFALRRLSDRVCIEHDLSVIQNPKQHSKGRYLHYGQWIGEKPPSAKQRVRLAIVEALQKQPTDFPAFLRLMEESGFLVKHGRGGVISFLAPGQDKPTRLRASTLGDGFDPEDIRSVIAGERPIPELPQEAPAPARCVNLIINIQERMAQGKGPAYKDKKLFSQYSLGMKQRLAIALAVMHDPELLILDEPINGLDPIGIAEVRSFIRELCDARGKTILISSHILSEISLLADDIGIIDHGALLEEESLAELEQKSSKHIRFTLSDTAQAARILERNFHENHFSIQDDHNLRLHNLDLPVGKIVTAFVENGLEVSEAHTCEESLEDYFKRVTGGEGIA